ncbi:flagellar hook assembly protein FlgD [Sphingomonas immobilis]
MSTFDNTLASLGIKTTASTAAAKASTGSQTLGQSDFLKLMTAQLNNQDPFNPVDNQAMVAQMAQISATSGISEMSTTLKSIADKLNGTSTADALSYVGKTVLTEGSTAYGRTAGGLAGAVELDGDASDVNVTISDANGNVLKNLSLGKQSKGTISYDWDGKTEAGADAGAGPFKVKVSAQNAGSTVTSRGLVWAPVEAVSMPASGSPVLSVTGIGSVAISAVRKAG